MPRKFAVGDRVLVKLFNSMEGRFYGNRWEAWIMDIDYHHKFASGYEIGFRVSNPVNEMWVHRKEILRRMHV